MCISLICNCVVREVIDKPKE